MKRIFAGMTAALLAVILVFSFECRAISANSAILMDAVTGRVLYEKNANERSLIASTTKIMTAILICEQCNVLDRVKIPGEAVGIEGSSMYLQEGEILTVQELLYGLMLQSGNDAATALAIYCAGSVDAFSQLMNDKAHHLGLEDTHFENPHGLDAPHHYATAKDLAVLSAYAMENPIFAKTVSTQTVHVGHRYFRNHNKLLWQLSGADGVKTGYTKAAGRILVSSASRSGRRLIAVTISDPNDWKDHITLMEQGFKDYSVETLVTGGEVLGMIEVVGGSQNYTELLAKEDFIYSLSSEDVVEVRLPALGFVYAPISAGQSAGYAHIYLNDHWIGNVELEFGNNVEQMNEDNYSMFDRLRPGGHL